MLSIRLPAEFEFKLAQITKREKKKKSDVIKEALRHYFQDYDHRMSAYELGKDLFGKTGSGDRNLASNYKQKIKEMLHAKHAH